MLLISVVLTGWMSTRNAFAVVPTIDGILTVGEWDAFIAEGFDPNEALIPNAYDLSHMKVFIEDTGSASDDGVYVLLETYAAPSLVDTGIGIPPASIGFLLDPNGDDDFADAVDFQTIHQLTGFEVFDGTGASLLVGTEGTHFKLSSVIEYYIPSSILSGFPYGNFSSFALYDNGGDAPDDRLPNTGFTTNIPEPQTLLLLIPGLLGLMNFKKFSI